MPNFELSQLEADFQVNDLKSAVLKKLKEGESTFSVAIWLQQDLLLYPNISPAELSRAVKEMYIAYTPLADRIGISKNRTAIQRTADKMRRRTSALEDLELLRDVQLGRINLIHEEELRLRDERDKTRDENEFEDEVEEVFAELETKGKKKKKKDSDAYTAIVMGVGSNEIEVARRVIMDIHKIRQDLKLDPRATDKDDVYGSKGPTPEYEVKRAKLVQDAVRKAQEQQKSKMTIEVEA